MDKNITGNVILVLGNHRSGTSITTEILQGMMGNDFPFPVTRHKEPEELVDMHTQFLKRHNLEFLDRLYFPDLEPDRELIEDYLKFFARYSKDKCVVKEPVLAVMDKYMDFHSYMPCVVVKRNPSEMIESLMHNKKFTFEKAKQIVDWNRDQFEYSKQVNHVFFGKDKELYKKSLKNYLTNYNIPIEWKEKVFEEKWDKKMIQPYKHGK
jgi:hypothetical protein